MGWNAARKLTWSDYKADPNPESDAAASTTTYLAIDYNISSTSFSYKIQSLFSKTRSWGLHKTNYILSHEQAHFDIAEIFARKLNKGVSEYQFNKSTFQNDLNAIYKSVVDEKEKFQQQYDDETDYSRNKAKQEEWFKKIESELKQNKSWAGY